MSNFEKRVGATLEEKKKQREELELEIAMMEAEPNRKILVSVIENDVELNEKITGLKADEVRVVAKNFLGMFDRAMIESEAELKEMRVKAEQKLVEDKPAYDEIVTTGYVCTKCKETKTN